MNSVTIVVMNIKALKAFRLVMIEGSITLAAKKIFLSQSATSRLLSSLENELGIALFIRNGRNLSPTKEGMEFFKEASRILNQLDEIQQIADNIKVNSRKHFRIITMPRISSALVLPAATKFLTLNPDVTLNLDIRTHRDAEQWLIEREYDIGIGLLAINHSEINNELLINAKLHAMIPKNNPLAKKDSIKAEDLIGQAIISLTPRQIQRKQLDDFFHSAGIKQNYLCETSSSSMACQLANNGLGISLTDPISNAETAFENTVMVPLKPAKWTSFGLIYRHDFIFSDYHNEFVNIIKKNIKAMCLNNVNLQYISNS